MAGFRAVVGAAPALFGATTVMELEPGFAGAGDASARGGETVPAGFPAAGGAGLAASFRTPSLGLAASAGGLSGTDGSRCARISAARTVPVWSWVGSCSTSLVTTSTSSSLLRFAAGFTRIVRNKSGPFPTLVTVPTGSPLGKIRSPPLVQHFFSGLHRFVGHDVFQHDFAGGSSAHDTLQAGFFQNAPTPLIWSSISRTCAVDPNTCRTFPTMPSAVMTAMSGLMPSCSPLSMYTDAGLLAAARSDDLRGQRLRDELFLESQQRLQPPRLCGIFTQPNLLQPQAARFPLSVRDFPARTPRR